MGKLKLRLALTAGVALAVLAGTVTAGGAVAGVDLGAPAREGASVRARNTPRNAVISSCTP